MPRLTKWMTVVAVLGAQPLHAQTVLVQVVGADDAQPLIGALAHLVDASGEVVTSRLADRSGRVLFAGIDPGRYTVRAEMLGRATGESDQFGVVADGSEPVALVLRLQPRAIALAGVEVSAEAGPSEVRPEEGRLLADVWDEARKALSAAAVTDQEGVYRYSLVIYERDLDTEGVVENEEQTRQRGYMRRPFVSQAIDRLTTEGFVRRTISEWTYYAPDADALLSDPFLDTHCFRLVDGGPDHQGLIGLSFEPTGENEDVPDVSGTLWLDRASLELEWLEYTYENLEPEVRPGDATGRVDFQHMPAGTWIVPRWWIRSPLVEVDINRSRRRITGFRESGGQVVEALEVGGRDLGRGVTTGAIEGIVVDSLGVPIQGVRVGTVGSNQTLFTNAEGRFNLVNLMEGTYRVRFVDPDLEALGFQPTEITREVLGGVSGHVELLMPKPGDLVREACGDEATPDRAVLAGIVRDAASGRPIPNATVRVTWSQAQLIGAGSIRFVGSGFETITDGFGVYRFCSVPRREELTLVSSVDEVESAPSRLGISSDEDAHVSVLSYEPARGRGNARPEAPAAAPEVEPRPSSPPFTKTGTVRDAESDAPLAEALLKLAEIDLDAVSDAEGRVTLPDLEPGSYALSVERLSYEPIEGTLEVADDRPFLVLLDRMADETERNVGAIVGQVTGERGESIGDVDISVVGQDGARTLTNQQGRFRIDGLEPGLLQVQFDRLGYASRSAQFVVQRGRTAELAVVMATQAVELEPIEVTVRAQALVRNGFYERFDRGFGTQFDRKALEQINPDIMYDVVRRAPGVEVTDPRRIDPFGRGGTVGNSSYAMSRRPATTLLAAPEPPNPRLPRGPCYLSVYVDGARMSDPDLSAIQPSMVEALEVYTGGDVPAQYTVSNPCGVILVWTRR